VGPPYPDPLKGTGLSFGTADNATYRQFRKMLRKVSAWFLRPSGVKFRKANPLALEGNYEDTWLISSWKVKIRQGRIDESSSYDTCYLHQVSKDVDVEQIELADQDRLKSFIIPIFLDHLNARAENFLSTVTS
jgi:hypothetical protein